MNVLYEYVSIWKHKVQRNEQRKSWRWKKKKTFIHWFNTGDTLLTRGSLHLLLKLRSIAHLSDVNIVYFYLLYYIFRNFWSWFFRCLFWIYLLALFIVLKLIIFNLIIFLWKIFWVTIQFSTEFFFCFLRFIIKF